MSNGFGPQLDILDKGAAAGDQKLAAAAGRIFDRSVQGVTPIPPEVMSFGRGWLHKDEQVTAANNRGDRMHSGRAILANCSQISRPPGKSGSTKLGQFYIFLF